MKLGTRRTGDAAVSASVPGPREQRSISADLLRNLVKGEGEASLSLPAPRRRPHAVTLRQREEPGSAVPDSAGTFPWLRGQRGRQICFCPVVSPPITLGVSLAIALLVASASVEGAWLRLLAPWEKGQGDRWVGPVPVGQPGALLALGVPYHPRAGGRAAPLVAACCDGARVCPLAF